ncbi:MAG: hypothetical protein R3B06_13875 [Kofleriaceae bacterium]
MTHPFAPARSAAARRSLPVAALTAGVALAALGCDPPYYDDPRDAAVDTQVIDTVPIDTPRDTPQGDCPAFGTPTQPSLVVTDPAVLARFSFARVMSQIRATADVASTQTDRATFQAWMRTFGATSGSGDCDDPTIDPEHFGLQCPRQPELKLASVDPFPAISSVQFIPLGLFNRFDLAPADGANCGEYRIIFGMSSQTPAIAGRALIIFEGILANPNPAAGIDACLPVAQFWRSLASERNPDLVAARLERFYFTGSEIAGFPPVVAAQSYGLARGLSATHGAGQIRTNFFIDSIEWQLREFKLRRTCTDSADASTCRLVFEHVPVKANPGDELFAGGHRQSPSFQSQFVAQVPRLLGTNVNALSIAPAEQFDEYESVSSRAEVLYDRVTEGSFRAAIANRLGALASFLTPTDVLNRASTQTCAGCHQQTNNLPLGGGMVWPPSLEFTHIDENLRLSPALTQQFLPHRQRVLENFINARCGAPTARTTATPDPDLLDADAVRALAADARTIGGSAVGAAN